MVTLFAAAYMAEIDPRRPRRAPARPVRGGRRARARLLAVDAADHHAAGAEDLDPRHRQQLHLLFKDTTLVAIIGLLDPLGLVTAIRADSNWNGIVWELYGFVALLFFVCCFGMSRYSKYLERKLRTDHR